MRQSKKRSTLILLLYLIIGGVVGDLLGTLAARLLPVLGQSMPFGTPTPLVLDLALLKLTFGLQVGVNLLGMLGIIVAIVLWLRS